MDAGIWVLAALVIALLMMSSSREGFITPETPRKGRFDRDRLRTCLKAAVDTKANSTSLATVPVDEKEVRPPMAQAVSKINERCGIDLFMVSLDGIGKQSDAVGNIKYSATLHVYSRRMNTSAALAVSVLKAPGEASRNIQILEASPISNPPSGPEPAPTDGLDDRFSKVDTFGGLL